MAPTSSAGLLLTIASGAFAMPTVSSSLPVVPPLTPPACGAGDTPVKVFVMMGQSNMLGEGKKEGPKNSLTEAVVNQSQYQYLWDKSKNTWSVSKNVRNVFVMGSGGVSSGITLFNNEFMTAATDTPTGPTGMSPKAKDTIGPELGIGFVLGNYTSDPVMTLKTCIGNRALGWDLMPPGTPRREFTDSKGEKWEYCGYHDSTEKWEASGPAPPPATPDKWYAGLQYDGDTQRAYYVLSNLTDFYPGAKCYEVAGFFWWQGDRDSYDTGLSTNYEANLVQLIKQLRIQYGSPKAKFVTASLGQTLMNSTGNGHLILQAMENVADGSKYPEFAGNVAAVYTHPLEHTPGASNGHYGGDAFTYMNIGQAMGEAMVKLLKNDHSRA